MNCKIINIGILFVLINTLHISKAAVCTDIGAPTSFDVTATSGRLVIVWSAPLNPDGCDINYNLVLNINGVNAVDIELDKLFYVYDHLDTCYKVIATLTPIIGTGIHGKSITKEVSQEIGDPDLSLTVVSNRGILMWNAPGNSDFCDFRYNLILEVDNEEVANIELDKEFYVLDNVRTCSVLKATLVAVAASGVRSNEIIKEEPTGISQIANLELQGLTLSWDVLTKYSEKCEYRIKINGKTIGTVEGTSYNLQDNDISGTPCTSTDIEVIPLSKNQIGQSISKDVGVPPKELDNFEIEEIDDVIKISWADEFGDCIPDIRIEGVVEDLTYADNYVVIEKSKFTPCTTHKVIGQIKYNNEVIGVPLEKTFTKKPEKIEVFEVTTLPSLVIASWSDKFENCQIEISIDGKTPIKVNGAVSTVLNVNDFSLCISYEAVATAVDNAGNRGEPASTSFKRIVDWNVDTFGVVEFGDSIVPSWSNNFEHCYIEIMVRYGDAGVDFYDDHELTSDITPLDKTVYEYCMVYRVLFMVFDEDEFLLDSTEDRYEKLPSNNFAGINQLEISLNTINNYVSANWEMQDFKKCSLNYFGGCALDVAVADPLSEIAFASNNDVNSYEFSNCEITTKTDNFAIAIQPKYNTVDGERITCIYSIDYIEAETKFSFILEDSSSDAKCPNSDSHTNNLLKRNNPILSLITNLL